MNRNKQRKTTQKWLPKEHKANEAGPLGVQNEKHLEKQPIEQQPIGNKEQIECDQVEPEQQKTTKEQHHCRKTSTDEHCCQS